MIQFDKHIFQLGWFNHQLYKYFFSTKMSPAGLVIVTIVSKLVISCYFTFFTGIYNLLIKGLG